ncbi:hypothetical protein [Segetibacter aerophilus]|nr:hypothetical protein [Segetibacter aerophilus]
MLRPILLWIPENLDVEEIVKLNPHSFYNQGLKKENLLYVCSALVSARANHRNQMDKDETTYAPLCSNMLDQVVYNYNKYLEYLLQEGAIETDNHFIVGEKCRGYCFSEKYSGQRLKRVEVKEYRLKKAIRRARIKWKEEQEKEMRGYGYMGKWWDTGDLQIDEETAFQWIKSYEKEKIKGIQAGPKTKKDKIAMIKNAINTSEDFKQLVRRLNQPDAMYHFSGEGHRFYNTISILKRELRQFVTYAGQHLVEVDIKNSQPFFSLVLFKESFWQSSRKNSGQNLSLDRILKDIYNKIKNSNNYKAIITLLKTSETLTAQGFNEKNYGDLVVQGDLYTHLETLINEASPQKYKDRAWVKKAVMVWMYQKASKMYQLDMSELFKKLSPKVYELFRLVKSVQQNYLPIILQRVESFLVIDVICKRVAQEYPDIPFFTIHDSIITTKGNEALLESIMTQEIEAWTGYKPPLKCKEVTSSPVNAMN